MVELLKEHLLRKPFAPFRVSLRDGKRLEVTRQFQVALGLTKFSYAPPKSRTTIQLELNDIVSLEPLIRTS